MVSNDLFEMETISIKAKYLYLLMRSKSNNWEFYNSYMTKKMQCQTDTLRKHLKELISIGLIVNHGQMVVESGKFSGNSYEMFDLHNPHKVKPCTKKPYTVKADTAKVRHLPILSNNQDLFNQDLYTTKNKEKDFVSNVPAVKVPLKNDFTNEFEMIRATYPGRKRGLVYEFKNFKAKHGKKLDLDFLKKIFYALKIQIEVAEDKAAKKEFHPNFQNFTTWINQSGWEMEQAKVFTSAKNVVNSNEGSVDEVLQELAKRQIERNGNRYN